MDLLDELVFLLNQQLTGNKEAINPKCGEQLNGSVGEGSPYKYFLEHKYIRG
jgi:hypothetical protein